MTPAAAGPPSGDCRSSSSAAAARAAQVACGIDEAHVRERLRKIAQHAVATRIVFLGEQANVVSKAQQVFEQFARFIVAALEREIISEPETAVSGYALVVTLIQAIPVLSWRCLSYFPVRSAAAGCSSNRVTSSLSTLRRSMSTTSKRRPALSKWSPTAGIRPT